MNLVDTIEIYCGGEGSGCNPDVAKPRCGRPYGVTGLPSTRKEVRKDDYDPYLEVYTYDGKKRVGSVEIGPWLTMREEDKLDEGRTLKMKKQWQLTGMPEVIPSYQGKGYGQRLYYSAFREAWKGGADYFRSDARESQSELAQAAWKRMMEKWPKYISTVGQGSQRYYQVNLKKWFGKASHAPKYLITPEQEKRNWGT